MAPLGLWATILVLLLSQQCFEASFIPEHQFSGYDKIDYDAYISNHVGTSTSTVVEASDADYSDTKPHTNKIEMFAPGSVFEVVPDRPLLSPEGTPHFYPYKSYEYTTANKLPLDDFKDLRVPPAATSTVSNSYESFITPVSLTHPSIPKLDYSSSYKEPVMVSSHTYLPNYDSSSIASSSSYSGINLLSGGHSLDSLKSSSVGLPSISINKNFDLGYSSPISSKTSETTSTISLNNNYDVASKAPLINTAVGGNFMAPYKEYSFTKVQSNQNEPAKNLEVPSASYSSLGNSFAPSVSSAYLTHPSIPSLDISSSYVPSSSHSYSLLSSSSIPSYSSDSLGGYTISSSKSLPDYSGLLTGHSLGSVGSSSVSLPSLSITKEFNVGYSSPESSKTTETTSKISLNNNYDVASVSPIVNTAAGSKFLAPYKEYSFTKVQSNQNEPATNLEVPSASYSSLGNSFAPSVSSAYLTHPSIPSLDISSSYVPSSSHSYSLLSSSSIPSYSSDSLGSYSVSSSKSLPDYSGLLTGHSLGSVGSSSVSLPSLSITKEFNVGYSSPESSKTSESTSKISLNNNYDVASVSPIVNTAAGSKFLAPYKEYSFTTVQSNQNEPATNLDVPSVSYSSIGNSFAPSVSSAYLTHPSIPSLDISSSLKDLTSTDFHSYVPNYNSLITSASSSSDKNFHLPNYKSYSSGSSTYSASDLLSHSYLSGSSASAETTSKISLDNNYDVASKAPLINTAAGGNFMAPYKEYSFTKVQSNQNEPAKNLEVPSASYSSLGNSFAPSVSSAYLTHPSIPSLDISSSYVPSSSHSYSLLSSSSIPSYSSDSLGGYTISSSKSLPDYSGLLTGHSLGSVGSSSVSLPSLSITKEFNVGYSSPESSKTSETTSKISLNNNYDVASVSPIVNTAAGSKFLAPYKEYSFTTVQSNQNEPATNLDVPSVSYSSIGNSFAPSVSSAYLTHPSIPSLDISSSLKDLTTTDFHSYVPNYNSLITSASSSSDKNFHLPNYKSYSSGSSTYSASDLLSHSYSSGSSASAETTSKISLDNNYDVASKAPLINTAAGGNFMAPYKEYSFTKVQSSQNEPATNLEVPSASYSSLGNSFAPSVSSAYLTHPSIPSLDISSSYVPSSSHSYSLLSSSSIPSYSSDSLGSYSVSSSKSLPDYSGLLTGHSLGSVGSSSVSLPSLSITKEFNVGYSSPESSKTSETTSKISLNNNYDVASVSPIVNTAAGSKFLAPYKEYSFTTVQSKQNEPATTLDVPSVSYSSIGNSFAPSVSSAYLTHPSIPSLDISSSLKDLTTTDFHSYVPNYNSLITSASSSSDKNFHLPNYKSYSSGSSTYSASDLLSHSYSSGSSASSETTSKISLDNNYDVASKAPLINTAAGGNFMAPYKEYSFTKVQSSQNEPATNLEVPSASYSSLGNSFAPSVSSAYLTHPSIPSLDISSSYTPLSSHSSHVVPEVDLISSFVPPLSSYGPKTGLMHHSAKPLFDTKTDAVIGYECPSGFKLAGNKCYEIIVQDAEPIKIKVHG